MNIFKRIINLVVFLSLFCANIVGFVPNVTTVQAAGIHRADALVLVNSASASYPDFEHFIQPYLDHFGVPYTLLDIAISAVPASADLGDYALIIVGHRQLDPAHAYLDTTEEGYISAAVSAGTGLVNFDNDLATSTIGNYAFVQSVFGFSYASEPGSGSSVSFPEGVSHYITERHTPGSSRGLFSSMTLSPIAAPLPTGVTSIALSGTSPFLAVTTSGTGRAVQWGSYNWMSNAVLGPVYGLDDLVWRSIVWAARKPFVMQGMPPFVTMRVDDESGSFDWIHVANEYGYKPWAGLFIDNIDDTEAADLSALVHAGKATATIHAYGGSFFYTDHASGNLPDATVATNFAYGTAWHAARNIPIGKFMLPHYYELGNNVFQGLSDWGVYLIGTMQDPGTTYGAPWIMNGPFRKFETGGSGDGRPLYYAGYMTIPGHPEFDHKFFNVVTEIRDDAGYEWYPNLDDVSGTIGHGTRQLIRALDGMQLATLFTHGYYVGGSWGVSAPANWRAILAGINTNIASYNPIFVTMDEAAQYIRATYDSNITSATYDPATKTLTTNLGVYGGATATDVATKFYVFMDSNASVMVDVPAFTGTTSVPYTLPGPLHHITVSPANPSVPAAASRQFTATGYDIDNNPIPNLPFTWSVTNGGGTIDAFGLFTAGAALGTFTDTVTATASAVSGSTSVTVTTPVVHHFEFASIASPKYAGAPFSITIRARDEANALVPGFTGTATLSSSTGTLSPNITGNFTGGVWTGQVSIAEAVTGVTINAASGSATGTSGVFDVSGTPTCPCSIWDSSAIPSIPHNSDPQSVELGVKFRSGTDGYITALRVYRGVGNLSATYSGHLWNAAGVLLATATFPAVSSAGWQQAVLNEPVPITADTTYVASYFTTTGYPVSRSYFTTANRAAYERPPLLARADGDEGGNGVYNYDSNPVFPTMSSQSSNYYIDVVFETEPGLDTTPPAVSVTVPAAYALGVNVNTDITAVFSEPLNPGTIDTATFELRDAGNALIPATVTYEPATLTARLNPDAALAYNTTYTATLTTGIADLAGNHPSTNIAWSFTTERQLDHFTFSAISSPQVSGTAFSVTIAAQDPTNNLVPTFTGTVALSASGGATILPETSGAFSGGSWTGLVSLSSTSALTGVTMTATNGSITGTSSAFDLNQSTGCPCSVWTDATTPADPYNLDSSLELGFKFRSSVVGYITGLRVYRGPNNLGAFDGHLWSASGTLLGSALFPASSTVGWQQAPLAVPVSITANTTYVASYHTNTGYSRTTSYFTEANRAAYERPPLRALVSGEDGGNGLYAYNANTTFPTSFTGTNYFVDVVFDTQLPVDTTPPAVQTTIPAANAVWVNAGADITAAFSEALDPATIGAATFELRDAGNTLVSAAVTYDPATYTARLNPDAALSAGTIYTATLKAGITDMAGNHPLADYSWSFTTAEVVDHFEFDLVSSPQTIGTPFSITIRARGLLGGLVSTYTGTAALSASGGAAVTFAQTGAFSGGVWTGLVYLSAPGSLSGVTITAVDGSVTGQSAAFDLVSPAPAPAFYTVTSPAYTYNQGESFTVNVAAYQGLTINGWEDAHQFPVLTETVDPATLTPPIPNDGRWTEFLYIASRTYAGVFAGVDEENYGLPTMRFYAGNIPSGTYTVMANLYDNAAMRYHYGFTAADPKAQHVDVLGGAAGTQFREYSLGTVTITDGNFNLYFRDADYLSGQDYRVFGWSWVRLVPVGNVATGDITLSSSSVAVQFDGNSNGTFGEAGDATKALVNGTLSINARDTGYGSGVAITASDAEGRSGQHLYTILHVNTAPVAVGDSYSAIMDTPLTVAAPGVLGNDSDVDNDTLSAVTVSEPAHGTLALNSNGSFTYTPTAGYSGPDSFSYQASDGTTTSNTATVSISVRADLIFADGFESGNLAAWSASRVDGGDLSVSTNAALVGSQGLQAVIDDNNAITVTDDSPTAEARYRARFYFDPNGITMANGDAHSIFYAYNSASLGMAQITLYYSNGYYVRVGVVDNGTTWRYSTYSWISDGPHYFEIDWRAAAGAGANDGSLAFWIDGVQRGSVNGIDNDTRRIDRVVLGAVSSIDTGTRGTYYFDAFESRRQSAIGMAGVQADFSASVTSGGAPLEVSFSSLSQPVEKISSYLWTFGDGGSSTEANPIHTYTANGDYTVSLAVTGDGATDTETRVGYIHVTDLIFADGFESGNLAAWSASRVDGGDLSVSTNAALVGSQGLQAVIDDNNAITVTDDSPTAEARYRARFYFDPNGITMANGDAHSIFYAYNSASLGMAQITLYYSNGYYVRVGVVDNGTTWRYSTYSWISDGPHYFEIDWRAAAGAGANDGSLAFWIDGVQRGSVNGIDNDTRRIDRVVLGAVSSIDTGTRGTYYFDAFESRRQSAIGMAGVQADFSASVTSGGAPLEVSFSSLSQPVEKISSYLWTFGDGGSSTEANPIHTYTANGDYTVSLAVTGDGATDTETRVSYIHVTDLIFADGFESGNLAAWSASRVDGGDLSVSANAALVGSQGLQAVIDDNNAITVTDDSPTAEARYRARFYFDPNGITMANGDAHSIFYAYNSASLGMTQITLYYSNGYYVRVGVVDNGTTWRYSTYSWISDGPHYFEIDWRAAAGAGANDGSLAFWIDGVQRGSVNGIDNDTRRIDRVVLGAVSSIDTGTRGTYYFDAFESRRQSAIGMAGVQADFTASPTRGAVDPE